MYGEKVEEANELRLDLADVKEMYKAQVCKMRHSVGRVVHGYRVTIFLQKLFNFLPNNKILDFSKLEAFADEKINIDQMMICVEEKIM